ncbi:hypothetical protein TYRP_016918 [Tyrophagus putrescentiae]|nr:hypothetical protein TYRP_016918 [Tyrophagus putrescentiae]
MLSVSISGYSFLLPFPEGTFNDYFKWCKTTNGFNSRPLFVYEGQIITPSHFSARRPLMQIPPIGSKIYSNLSQPKLIQRYKDMQSHVNAVWNAWYSQYLLTLRSFHQNLFEPNQADSLRVGDAVLLKNPTPSETCAL